MINTFSRSDHIRELRGIIDYLKAYYPNTQQMPASIAHEISERQQQLRFWEAHEHYLAHKNAATGQETTSNTKIIQGIY